MKKLITLLFAIVMTLSMSGQSFAFNSKEAPAKSHKSANHKKHHKSHKKHSRKHSHFVKRYFPPAKNNSR